MYAKTNDDVKYLIKILEWLKASLERTPSENRRQTIKNTRYWSLRTRLPFLFQMFLSDLWIIPFNRIHGIHPIWNYGDKFIHKPTETIRETIIRVVQITGKVFISYRYPR